MSSTDTLESGFTLVELLIALTLLALSASVTVAVISPALQDLGDNTVARSATMYAQSLLARVGADIPLIDSHITGRDQDLSWNIDITPWPPIARNSTPSGTNKLSAHLLRVSVSWQARHRAQVVALATVRLDIKQ